jgi:hypothetical protein
MPKNGKNANNVEIMLTKDTMTIVIDLKRDLGPSSSGKNILVASTRGIMPLSNGMSIGLNVMKPKD